MGRSQDSNREPTGRHSSARAKGGRGRSKERRAEPEPEGGEETGAFGFASAFQTLVQEAEEIPTEAPRQTDEHPLDTEQNTANKFSMTSGEETAERRRKKHERRRSSQSRSRSRSSGSGHGSTSPARRVLLGEESPPRRRHRSGSKQLGGPKLLTHLKREREKKSSLSLRRLLIQSGLFKRVSAPCTTLNLSVSPLPSNPSTSQCPHTLSQTLTAGLKKMGLEAPTDMKEASLRECADGLRPPLLEQAVQAEKISEVWAERAARMKDQERRTEACLS
ncbi:hypothetical protein CYMTET_51879, partial [Cymbomonas tetramitiformis]